MADSGSEGNLPAPAEDNPRNLLKREAEAAAKALRAGGDVSPQALERLQRIQQVVQAYDATHPSRRRRWPVAAMFVASLVLCSLLLFVRRREVDIRLDLAVAEAAFVLRTEQKLTEAASLTMLGLSGMREIQLPPDRTGRTRTLFDGVVPPIRLAVAPDGATRGSITLETVILPGGARVRVRADDRQGLRLSVQRAAIEGQASVYGPVELGVAGEGTQRLEVPSPEPILFRPAQDADLDLVLAAPGERVFAVPLPADSLSFVQVDRSGEETRTLVRRTSSILSGSLFLESLDGVERKIRPGEILELSGSRGEVTGLSVEAGHLTLRYEGRVTGMTIGAGENRRSLMPTWLEWLKARRSAWLLWGTAVYVFGLVMGFHRWLRTGA